MKQITLSLIALVFTSLCVAQSNFDEFIFPDPKQKIAIVAVEKGGMGMPKGKLVTSLEGLSGKLMEELDHPFHQQMIRVSQCARNLAKNSQGPNILFLSQEEGGFPRQGIELIGVDENKRKYPDLHYVDLMIDERRFADGALSIYTHELGHIMMNLLLHSYWDIFPNPTSPKQHVSMGITDQLTAFYEGWGVHFQRLTFDQMPAYAAVFNQKFSSNRAATMAWHSNLDEYLRLTGVLDNLYIYQKAAPTGIQVDTLSIEEQILFEHTNTNFDHSSIKNAQQMLACEGVLATLFYQINTNAQLQNSYAGRDWYQNFLLADLPSNVTPESVFTPLENVYLKNLWIWHQLQIKQPEGPVMMSFIQEWCKQFPADTEALLGTFIMITRGKTMSNDLADINGQINHYGQVGNIQKFRSLLPAFNDSYKSLLKEAMDQPETLQANLGPELWITHKKMKIQRTLWMEKPKGPLHINLNTASLPEVMAFIPKETAMKFIKTRDELGFFSSIEQLNSLGFNFTTFK